MIDIFFVGGNEFFNLVRDFILDNFQIKAVKFENLVGAVKKLSSSRHSILLIDLEYHSNVNSYSLSAAKNISPNLHIITFTEDDSLDNIRSIKEKEINDIILKPFNNKRLRDTLQKVIHRLP